MFFGSGPTKKDAKFASGTIAWAAIMNPAAAKAVAQASDAAQAGSTEKKIFKKTLSLKNNEKSEN